MKKKKKRSIQEVEIDKPYVIKRPSMESARIHDVDSIKIVRKSNKSSESQMEFVRPCISFPSAYDYKNGRFFEIRTTISGPMSLWCNNKIPKRFRM